MAELPKIQLPEKLPFSKHQLVIAGTLAFGGIVLLSAIYFGLRTVVQTGPGTTLTIWGVSDGTTALGDLTKNYQAARSGVTINFKEFDPEEYNSALLNALAAGQGPDVFMIHNRSLPRNVDKLIPADPGQFSLQRLQDKFPSVVEKDFTSDGQVYALPLYLDTLALIYNKDLLDQGGIANYPKTWDDVQNSVQSLRQLDSRGQVVRAAVALGGSKQSIFNGVDILNLLMLQNGTAMTNPELTAADFLNPAVNSQNVSPGLAAFNFYIQFANAGSSYYTWNDNQPEAFDSFAGGKTAMIFGYHSDIAKIKEKSPFIKLGVAPMPQLSVSDSAVNYPSYWGLAASRQSKVGSAAWDFITYATTDEGASMQYINSSRRPPALRSLIAQIENDPEYGVFAKQALTARSWYSIDEDRVNQLFNSAIQNVINGKLAADLALSQLEDQVTHLMSASANQSQ